MNLEYVKVCSLNEQSDKYLLRAAIIILIYEFSDMQM